MTRLEAFENVKQNIVRRHLNDTEVKNIANMKLAKDWKWGVAERVFNDDKINYDLFCEYLNIPDPRNHQFSDKAKGFIENELSSYTFLNFDFGRKKNRDNGYNNPRKIKSGNLQHENTFEYKGKHRGRLGSDLCPDYAVIFHRTQPKIMYRLPWMDKPETMEFNLVPGIMGKVHELGAVGELRFQLKGDEFLLTENNMLYRVSSFSFKGLPITWNEEEKAFQHPELGDYHVSKLWIYKQDIHYTKESILKAFQRRKEYNTKERNFLERAKQVFVTMQDSIQAGNCEIQTREFAKEVRERFFDEKPELGNVNLRGDTLLKMRNDNFTQRAVKRAINRELS